MSLEKISRKQILQVGARPSSGLRRSVNTLRAACAVLLMGAASSYAGQAKLAWDANASAAVVGYFVYYGQNSGNYSGKADAGNKTSYTVGALMDGKTYYYAVTAYDAGRAESAFSNEARSTVSASGSTPVATTSGGAAATGGGGAGGCTLGIEGNAAAIDPMLPLLLLMGAYYVLHFRSSKLRHRLIPGSMTQPR